MIKTRLGAQRYNNRMDKIFEQARANSAIDSGVHALMSVQDERAARRWPVEFICNGETQVMGELTAEQVQEITKMIKEKQ